MEFTVALASQKALSTSARAGYPPGSLPISADNAADWACSPAQPPDAVWRPSARLLCNGPRSLPSILSRELPVGFSDSFRHLEGKVGMLACQWDRIHACIGKPSIPLEAERKNSIRRAPTKSVSGPSSRLILRG